MSEIKVTEMTEATQINDNDLLMIVQNEKSKKVKLSTIKKQEYSTEEQVVGTWIDGKPLYRKVVTGTTKNVVSGEIDTKIGITNVDTVISYSANVDGWIITYLTRLINMSGTLRLDIMNQGSDSGFSVKPFKCIVEYTKTTD